MKAGTAPVAKCRLRTPRGVLGCALLAALALLATPLLPGHARAQDVSSRSKVARRKALFIEQFTRYIDWPADAMPKAGPFVLCIEGASDTGNELTALASGRKFKDRPVELRRPKSATDLGGCHLVYLAGSEADRLNEVLAAVVGKPILTVSDTNGFVERGVHLNLFEQTRSSPEQGLYVNYELNVPAVKHSVLAFDPQLLNQGRRVDVSTGATPVRPGH
jgi:hypothetical protein